MINLSERWERMIIMSKTLLIASTMALSFAFMPSVSLAEDAAPAATTTETNKSKQLEISKDDWLNQMKPILPSLICKGFVQDASLKKRFDELKMTEEQCQSYIPDITKKCTDQYYAQIPQTINNESAATWGRTIGECIGKEYAEKYLIPKH